jgi:hypothetical protein
LGIPFASERLLSQEANMAKGQIRSTREKKKPKQVKPKGPMPASSFTSGSTGTRQGGKK